MLKTFSLLDWVAFCLMAAGHKAASSAAAHCRELVS